MQVWELDWFEKFILSNQSIRQIYSSFGKDGILFQPIPCAC
jgi:hypothetical protein